MSTPLLSKLYSLPELMVAPEPKAFLVHNLIKLLKRRLKSLNIIWNPTVFRKGLVNPRLPKWLLYKLENLLLVAETSGWKVSNALALELDETVEDIETFNPAFRAQLKQERKDALRDIRLGKAISVEALKREGAKR